MRGCGRPVDDSANAVSRSNDRAGRRERSPGDFRLAPTEAERRRSSGGLPFSADRSGDLTPASAWELVRTLCAQKKDIQVDVFFSERAGVRTPDNLIKSQVLYQLSYTPIFFFNAQFRNRTRDTRIFSPLLYQLS